MIRQVTFVFDSDSQYFACQNLVPYFESEGWIVRFAVLGDYSPPTASNATNDDPFRIQDPDELWQLPDFCKSQAVGVYLPGSKMRRVWEGANAWFDQHGSRPLLFAGYNGVVLSKFEEGLSWRTGYDLVALNSPEDLENAIRFNTMGIGATLAQMPVIGINRKRQVRPWAPDTDTDWEKHKRIVFAEQVMFPRGDREKYYLYSHLLRLAQENPDWEILIKPRTLPGGTTFHRQGEHVSRFLAKNFVFPGNMRICYDSLDKLIPQSTALLSISSTAFFDALALGIPSFTLSDFGVSNAYGTTYFHRAGTSICLADLTTLHSSLFAKRPNPEWLAYKGFDPSYSPAAVVAGLQDLLASGSEKRPPLPVDAEQRLLGPPADLPAQFRGPATRALARAGRRLLKYVARRISP